MLHAAVIGTGNISRFHIEAYKSFPERVKITHLVDIYPEKAQEKNTSYELNAQVLSSYKDILDDKSIDLVSIATPPYCHGSIAVDCLNAGKNVVVEKPMAASLEECDAMIAAAEKSGKIFSVIAQNRFRDPIWRLKKILDSGKIGRIVHAQVDSHWWRGHCYYDLWWRGTWEKEGGGCTLNHAVHHIDMLGWMLGRPSRVSSVLTNVSHDNAEVEDLSVAVFEYNGGALGQVTSSVVHHGEEQHVIFQGEKAMIAAPWKAYASVTKPNGFPIENKDLEKELQEDYEKIPELKYTIHTGQIENVLTAIETGAEPLIKGTDGRLTIELITAIYKAGTEKRSVNLPISPDDPFYSAAGIMKNVPHFYKKSASVENFGDNESITVGSDYKK